MIKLKQIKYSAGFTLAEVMVVVAIVGILSSIALPSFQGLIKAQRVKNASFELFASLITARSEAIKRNDDVTITPISGTWETGWQTTFAGSTLKDHAALTNIVVSGAPTSLIYKRTGRLSAASPSIQLDVNPADSEYVRCITIELSGLPRTKKGACS